MGETIALIGAGIMGQAIGARLLECGHALSVFDIDPAKVARLVAKGAQAVNSPAAATAESDFIILSLNHADIVNAAVFGPGEDGAAVLKPANPAYPVLRPGDRLQIFGVVVGLIRNYRR